MNIHLTAARRRIVSYQGSHIKKGIEFFQAHHPTVVYTEDALAANGSQIETLKAQGFSFTIRAKPDGNASLP